MSLPRLRTEQEEEAKKEEVAVEIEPKTGVSFPFKLDDGKQLGCVGLRKKSMLGIGIKIYGFGIYADNEKLRELFKLKIGKAPAKPTKDMYQLVIDSDAEMMVSLSMNMVRKNFDEGLGASIKKLTGGKKNEALANKVMGQASDDIKLTSGSVIEISRLPGNILQTKGDNSKTLICIKIVINTLEMSTTLTKSCVLLGAVIGEVVSKVESELLCRAYVNMYLGDDPLDKDTKEKFGMSLPSLF
ncbi:Chalcone-flavanone isomerase family protein [Prunus dulcis]|uniref:Chalcone-flavanone isomerase family protein n=1 Tax=Prunus dulcis TaxID=3755 RepID=A0A4Y1R8E3_PRUDU|nr:Chalcone-flavanone isomerase family protein [Prunus dulcis]